MTFLGRICYLFFQVITLISLSLSLSPSYSPYTALRTVTMTIPIIIYKTKSYQTEFSFLSESNNM